MSGPFYQRYIPSTPKHVLQETCISTSPEFFKRYNPTNKSSEISNGAESEDRPLKRPRIYENLPNREKAPASNSDIEDEHTDGFKKHQRTKAKYEKVLQISDKKRKLPASETKQTTEEQVSVEKHGLEPLPQPENKEVPSLKFSSKDSLPYWLANPILAKKEARIGFDALALSDNTRQNLRRHGFSEAFAIQSAVLPMLLQKKPQDCDDICVSASTGSGKTLSYVLPIVEALGQKPVRLLRALIVVPTRELVNQVRETLEMCTSGTDIKVGIALGNRTLADDRRHLLERKIRYDPEGYSESEKRKNNPSVDDLMDWETDSEDEYEPLYQHVASLVSSIDILVCTPGRLVDHVRYTKGFHLHDIQWLVIDEADKLIDQSFQQWIDTVIPEMKWMPSIDARERHLRAYLRLPQRRQVNKVILSATMSRDIGKLLSLDLKSPKLVILEGQSDDVDEVDLVTNYSLPPSLREEVVALARNDEKPLVLVQLLRETVMKNFNRIDRRLPISKQAKVNGAFSERGNRNTSETSSCASESSSDSDFDVSTSSSDSDSAVSTSSSGTDTDPSYTSSVSISAHGHLHSHNAKGKGETILGSCQGVLVFTNTNEAAQRLSRLLSLLAPEWRSRIGTLSKSTASSSGRRLLSAFRAGKLSVLVASDRASRGLDLQELPAVINYDMPTSAMNYIHRVGRTARAGRMGTAYTLVSHHEARWFWKEIGRSTSIGRGNAKVVRREGLGTKVPEDLSAAYEEALEKLGEEAKGS